MDYWVLFWRIISESVYLYFLVGLFLIWKNEKEKLIIYCISAVFSYILSEFIFKNIFKVPRPKNPLIKVKGYSFPSSHTTVAFSIFYFFRNNIFFLIWSILIGVSRIVLRVHYIYDVLGGAILGFVVSFVFEKLFLILFQK